MGTHAGWKEYLSLCFACRAEIGQQEKVLRRDRCQPTLALESLFNQYKHLCVRTRLGSPTLVLYGSFGSGKSQTLLSIVRGNSAWNPDRAIHVNFIGNAENGNEYVERLAKTLKFPGKVDPWLLASAMVEAAVEPSIGQSAGDYLGCCGGVEQLSKGELIEFFPRLDPTELFDKIPVIALDNVKFDFPETAKLNDKIYGAFRNFITSLFEYAYGKKSPGSAWGFQPSFGQTTCDFGWNNQNCSGGCGPHKRHK